jgi:hypothetical protein
MKLLTKEIRNSLPKLYATESIPSNEKVAVAKFFYPYGRGTWYATEFDGEDTFFGYVVSMLGPDCDEYGYFSLSELESVKGPLGLGIERDIAFRPTKLSELLNRDCR